MKFKACIIEDESRIREALEQQLKGCGHELEVVGSVGSIAEAVPVLNRYLPDVVFLDVDLGGGRSGFDLFKEFPNPRFEVVFVTGFEHHAVKAIRFSCLDYLLKPVSRKELQQALGRLKERRQPALVQERIELLLMHAVSDQRNLTKIALPSRDGFVMQALALVEYFESDGNYATMYCMGQPSPVFVAYSLKELEAILPETFVRCHRSRIVNLNQIKEINKTAFRLHLDSGKWVEVSQRSLPIVILRLQG
jgi:two-component system LytT family response regulator